MATVFLKNSANSVRQLHEVINGLQEDFDTLQRDFRAANPAIDCSLKNHAEQFHRLYSRIDCTTIQLRMATISTLSGVGDAQIGHFHFSCPRK